MGWIVSMGVWKVGRVMVSRLHAWAFERHRLREFFGYSNVFVDPMFLSR